MTGAPSLRLDFPETAFGLFGIAGDRAEHILWRAWRLQPGITPPEVVFLLAGTNNLGKADPDSVEAVGATVLAIAETLQESLPESRIVLLSILPSGHGPPGEGLRKRIVETNAILAKAAAEPESGIEFLDVHDEFLGPDGMWVRRLTLDGTHLSLDGYGRLTARMAAHLEESGG